MRWGFGGEADCGDDAEGAPGSDDARSEGAVVCRGEGGEGGLVIV